MSSPVRVTLPIHFDDVSFVRGQTSVVEGLSLTIGPGAPTVLIGPNGSGKTTLLRLAMGLLTPTSGRILWAGRLQCPTTRQALVFQRPTMLRRSVAENIRFALRASRTPRPDHARRIEHLLVRVGLATLAGRPARSLSGGEQQRVALARALALDPETLLLDEPTASLDPAATQVVEELLSTAAKEGIKVIVSTHDLGQARRLAGDVLMLNRGRVIEHAPAQRFFKSPATPAAARFLAGDLLL